MVNRAGSKRTPRRARRRGAPTLADLVQRYTDELREPACLRLAFYAEQPSLAHALEAVAGWRDEEGRVEPHQKHLGLRAREEAARAIRALEPGQCTSFEQVHEQVRSALEPVRGIGPRTVYDVSLRIGAVLGLPPTRLILHPGCLGGARALGLPTGESSLPVSALPEELRRLHAWEIENLLACFGPELRRLAAPRRRAA